MKNDAPSELLWQAALTESAVRSYVAFGIISHLNDVNSVYTNYGPRIPQPGGNFSLDCECNGDLSSIEPAAVIMKSIQDVLYRTH